MAREHAPGAPASAPLPTEELHEDDRRGEDGREAVPDELPDAAGDDSSAGPLDSSHPLDSSRPLYLILTHSAKPVFYSSGDEEEVARYAAVIQAIVACFPQQELRVVESGAALIALQTSFPLILAAVDRDRRSAHQLRTHLDLLYAQVLSVLTKQQLEKQYRAKPGIDLRPLLGGTETFLRALVRSMSAAEPWTWLGALESLELRRSARARLNQALLDSRSQSSLLYGLVASSGRFGGVVRPRQHSLHPPDLHLVFNMLFNTAVFAEGENWVPICFPRFNANGFLYAYIRLISPETYLVLVSADKHGFFEMQRVGHAFAERLDASLAEAFALAARRRFISIESTGAAPLDYFVYKSRGHVQFIQSEPRGPRLNLRFAQLQAAMAAQRLRICWYKWGDGSVLGWHTPAFELYCYAKSDDREVVSQAVKRLVAWIRRYETRLFIVDGATF